MHFKALANLFCIKDVCASAEDVASWFNRTFWTLSKAVKVVMITDTNKYKLLCFLLISGADIELSSLFYNFEKWQRQQVESNGDYIWSCPLSLSGFCYPFSCVKFPGRKHLVFLLRIIELRRTHIHLWFD